MVKTLLYIYNIGGEYQYEQDLFLIRLRMFSSRKGLMDLFVLCVECLTVYVNCLVKNSQNMFGCGCYFVVECYGNV